MKIEISQLKKAVGFVEARSKDVFVNVLMDGTKLVIRCMDRMDNEIEIILFQDSTLLPKVRQTEILK